MSETDWARVDALFQAALEIPPSERAAWIEAACAGHPALRAELASLLEAHESSHDFLEPPATAPPPASEAVGPPALGVGARIGAYRLVRELGHGGMGSVYLGTRADGSFAHEVAVKVTRAALSDPEVARRVQVERQVLASLHHPHIVTLIDGGTTDAGQAYLVMEHVDGERITDWLQAREATLERRLRMFRQVCSAVHAAHQHGIVHRDLKPANILVTPDGVPKVLDFGIAKLLDADPGGDPTLTALGRGPLTPDYASPEQLRGLPVTTAGDIYSLGVLLFEILAGRRPYETTGVTLDVLLERVLHGPTRRVSAAVTDRVPFPATRLRGDLDAIVQKAMHVDPAERYGSAEELSDDVARFLGGAPVVAREPTVWYVLRKAAARHRAVVAAVVVGAIGVAVAMGLALWQRQVALEARGRAEARFDDVRQLANAMVFRVHDAVARVPGTTEARRLIVSEALGYLDRLAQEGGDPSLQLDLARGYKQVARALGDPTVANLGDYQAARVQLTRALEMLRPLRESAVWRDASLEAVHTLRLLASVEGALGRHDESRAAADRALDEARALAARSPDDEELRRTLASAHFNAATARPDAEAVPHWEEASRLFEGLWKARPHDRDRMRNVALVDKYYGRILIDQGRLEDGLGRYRRALELDERRLAAEPDSRQAQFDVAIDLANMGAGLLRAGQPVEAFAFYDRSVVQRERMLATDPKDRSMRLALVRSLARVAQSHVQQGSMATARGYVARAHAAAAADEGLQADRQYHYDLARLLGVEARLALREGDRARACARQARSRALLATVEEMATRSASDRAWFEETARLVGSCAP